MNDFYVKKLQYELSERCARNSRYSMRAYAKALKVDAGTLSKILSGKQIPTLDLAQRLIGNLDLNPVEREKFLQSTVKKRRDHGLDKLSPDLKKIKAKDIPQDLSLDLFRVISDIHHFAILELTFVEGFKASPNWIASELGISQIEAKLAIQRLLEFGLLKRQNGKLVKTSEQLATVDKHITTPAQKRSQKQFLEKALSSLENDPIELRAIQAMTMAVDPDKIPLARQMMIEFGRELCRVLESGKRKKVYNLQLCLTPLQK